jgi:alkanesulfonate monooxygenase SsuD/methylene tetrahydromethanopterin reductase-like flavin-dependent oxidoreductase (luciferase family)
VAEEVATVDVISGGRAFLGAGLGYRRYQWDALNLPFARRVSRMEECLTVVQAALSDERISFHGQHSDFDDVMVVPRPARLPQGGRAGDRDTQASSWARQSTPLRLSELGTDMLIAGNADDVLAGITRAFEVSGCEYLQPTFGPASFANAMSMLDLFGKEVMPAFCRLMALTPSWHPCPVGSARR